MGYVTDHGRTARGSRIAGFPGMVTAALLSAVVAACGGGGGGGGDGNGSTSATTIPYDDTPRFAYVINKSVIGGYVVDPESGNLIPRGHSQNFFETTPVAIAASPDGRFLYFSDIGGARAIKRYDINPSTGTHVYANGAEFPVDAPGAKQILIHPSGDFLFYRMNGTHPVSTLALDSDSGEMSAAGQTAPIRTSTMHLAPDGAHLYTTYSSGGLERDIQTFAVTEDGFLSPIDANPAIAGTQLQSFANSSPPGFNPSNGDVYLVDISSGGSINRYRREAGTGLLVFIDNTPIPDADTTTFGTWNDGLLVEPKGRFGYVRLDHDLIAGFAVDPADGTLDPIDYDPATAGIQHLDFGSSASATRVVSFEPSGHFVYFGLAGTSGTLEKYTIDQATGMLTRNDSQPELDHILALNGLVDGIVFTNRTGVDPPHPSFAYSRKSGMIGIHRVDPATGLLTDIGSFPIPVWFNGMYVDPAHQYLYIGESSQFTRVRIDQQTGALSDREVRSNARPNSPGPGRQGLRFDPHNRFGVQTRTQGDGMDLMEVVTGPPAGLGPSKTNIQFSEDPYTSIGTIGASSVRPNSRHIYSTGLVSGIGQWMLRVFELVATPVGFDRVDASGSSGHQDFPLPTGSSPRDTIVEPLGRYLLNIELKSSGNSDNLAVYELAWTNGVPTRRNAVTTPLVIPNHTTGPSPVHIALDPRGRFVYVPTDNGISAFRFTRQPTGAALESIDHDPITAGFQPAVPMGGKSRVTIDPTGQWLYSPGSMGTEGFSIDPDTGALTSVGIVSSDHLVDLQIIGNL